MCPKFLGWEPIAPGDLIQQMSENSIMLWDDDEAGADVETRTMVGEMIPNEIAMAITVLDDTVLLLTTQQRLGWSHRVWFQRA